MGVEIWGQGGVIARYEWDVFVFFSFKKIAALAVLLGDLERWIEVAANFASF